MKHKIVKHKKVEEVEEVKAGGGYPADEPEPEPKSPSRWQVEKDMVEQHAIIHSHEKELAVHKAKLDHLISVHNRLPKPQ